MKVICDDEFPDNCAADIRKGEVAPFNGILYSRDLAASLVADVETSDDRVDLEKKFVDLGCAIEMKRESDLRSLESKSCKTREKMLLDALKQETVWYKRPVFVMIVSSLATITLVVSTAYALDSVR